MEKKEITQEKILKRGAPKKYNTPQKLDNTIRWMLACHNQKRRYDKMRNIRKQQSAAIKAKVALEAVKGEETISQLSSKYGVHSNQIGQWKKRLLEELPVLFLDNKEESRKR